MAGGAVTSAEASHPTYMFMHAPLSSLPLLVPVLFSLLVAGGGPARAQGLREDGFRLVGDARKSVTWIIVYKDGRQYRATGFVIARPGDGKKIILTAGHIFQNGMTLTARLPGMARPVPCDLIDVSSRHDLMAVSPTIPIDAPALTLLGENDPQPALSDPVLVIGCPGGLDWAHYRGEINGRPVSAAELTRLLAPADLNGRKTPFGDVVLLRHNAFSSPGMSGGPLLDARGKVIGVQLGTLPKASNVSFSVHAKHIGELNLRAEPRRFEGGPVLDSDIGHALSLEKDSDENLVMRLGDQDVDVRCLHQGYVARDASAVISRFVKDERWFRAHFTNEQLQALLDETPVALITNPAFGFRVLVPKGYSYTIRKSTSPVGVIVTFTSGDPTVAAPYNTITVRAFPNTEYAFRVKRLFDDRIQRGDLKPPQDLQGDPFRQTHWRNKYLEGAQIGMVSVSFPVKELGIRARDAKGVVWGSPEREIFDVRSEDSVVFGETSWTRCNYDAEHGTIGHAVHYGIWENVIVIVHYQFQKKDRQDFFSGKTVNRSFSDRMFIASTISLY
jgi:hypothetical protein